MIDKEYQKQISRKRKITSCRLTLLVQYSFLALEKKTWFSKLNKQVNLLNLPGIRSPWTSGALSLHLCLSLTSYQIFNRGHNAHFTWRIYFPNWMQFKSHYTNRRSQSWSHSTSTFTMIKWGDSASNPLKFVKFWAWSSGMQSNAHLHAKATMSCSKRLHEIKNANDMAVKLACRSLL